MVTFWLLIFQQNWLLDPVLRRVPYQWKLQEEKEKQGAGMWQGQLLSGCSRKVGLTIPSSFVEKDKAVPELPLWKRHGGFRYVNPFNSPSLSDLTEVTVTFYNKSGNEAQMCYGPYRHLTPVLGSFLPFPTVTLPWHFKMVRTCSIHLWWFKASRTIIKLSWGTGFESTTTTTVSMRSFFLYFTPKARNFYNTLWSSPGLSIKHRVKQPRTGPHPAQLASNN